MAVLKRQMSGRETSSPRQAKDIAHPAVKVGALAGDKEHQDRADERREEDRVQDVAIRKHPLPSLLACGSQVRERYVEILRFAQDDKRFFFGARTDNSPA